MAAVPVCAKCSEPVTLDEKRHMEVTRASDGQVFYVHDCCFPSATLRPDTKMRYEVCRGDGIGVGTQIRQLVQPKKRFFV